ncbi:hypothetical protein SDC9_196652 [bioreactor metagenome]|uniref:Uncharacterized protein n=1 Tax=bioreactor metagenome TaxID=1076179 RepID=A0A645IEZ0_9ZZZZ
MIIAGAKASEDLLGQGGLIQYITVYAFRIGKRGKFALAGSPEGIGLGGGLYGQRIDSPADGCKTRNQGVFICCKGNGKLAPVFFQIAQHFSVFRTGAAPAHKHGLGQNGIQVTFCL